MGVIEQVAAGLIVAFLLGTLAFLWRKRHWPAERLTRWRQIRSEAQARDRQQLVDERRQDVRRPAEERGERVPLTRSGVNPVSATYTNGPDSFHYNSLDSYEQAVSPNPGTVRTAFYGKPALPLSVWPLEQLDAWLEEHRGEPS